MYKSEYLGGKHFVDNIVFHYRYFTVLYFSLIYVLYNYLKGTLVIDTDLYWFSFANLSYLIYVFVLQIFKLREKLSALIQRVLRINFDLIYFTIALFLIGNIPYPTYIIYLLPLLSAINYRKNRYYFLCASWISLYYFILQLSFFFYGQININPFIGSTVIFTLFVFSFAAIMSVYDKQYTRKEVELDKIKDFIQDVKHSSDHHEAFSIIIQELEKLTNVPIITIMLYDGRKNELFIAESCGIGVSQKTLRLKPGQGVCGNTFNGEKYILVNDTTNKKKNYGYTAFKDLPKPVYSELCFPLILKDGEKPIGVLNFEAYERNYFHNDLVHLINSIVRHIIYILEKTHADYTFNANIRKKTEAYIETILYLRELAHDWRNKLGVFLQIPDYVINKNGNDHELLKDLSRSQEAVCKWLDNNLNKALEAKTIYKPNLNNVKMMRIIRNVTNDNYYNIRQNNVTLSERIEFTGKIETDLQWLGSILNNLISNSIGAYEKNRIIDRPISMEVDTEDSEIKIILTDQAGGIDPELAKKISDPSQLLVKHGRIGLNLVKRYVRLLQGEIDCKNITEPPGTRFILTFPIIQKRED